jgi:acyl-coenzyme A synthetase/AMP-(fatty) acid ligase
MARLGFGAGAVYLSPAPLYHSAPLVYSMSLHRLGGTAAARLLPLSRAERERYDPSSLRLVMHAAAPCPVAVKRQMLDWWGPIICEYYAGTEDIGNTFITAQEWLAHPGSAGRPAMECHIVGEDGQDRPPGQPGVVYFAGGRPFEYHNDPAKTASIMNERGWRTLGDIGYLDADGYLYLTGRGGRGGQGRRAVCGPRRRRAGTRGCAARLLPVRAVRLQVPAVRGLHR